ncbi:MAG TPA: lamin tail domain-containing protein, partial [Candidatus Synoicihabitans sp.]|nr:lamin tail domain-containing protein [Candidatus Synoicihabitans sp.]
MTTRSVSVAATFRWLLATLVAAVNLAFGAPLITEFMASNATTLRDEDGDYSDWIEIHNPDTAAASLAGWHLTDAAGNKTKWTFPAGVSIPANGYLIVFASNKNRGTGATQLHTNFALSSGGEYLGLIQPDGTTVVSEFAPTYTAQSDDTSYGVTQPTGSEVAQTGYFTTATPGTRNGGANTLITLGEVTVSVPPGTFQGQLSLQLSGAASGEVIRYTLTAPSAAGAAAPAPTATSPAYTAPLLISESTIVKAAVFLGEDGVRGPVATAHYARISPELAGFTGQLPIIVLDNHG